MSKALADAQGQLTPKQDVAKALAEAAAKAKEAAARLPDEKDLAEAAATFVRREPTSSMSRLPHWQKRSKRRPPRRKLNPTSWPRSSGARRNQRPLDRGPPAGDCPGREARDALPSKAGPIVIRRNLHSGDWRKPRPRAHSPHAAAATSAVRAASDKLTADLAAAKALAAKLAADLPTLQAAQTAAQKANDEAQAALLAAKQVFDAKELARKEFADVLAKAEAAAAKLPQDAEIAQTTQKLKTRSDQLTAESRRGPKGGNGEGRGTQGGSGPACRCDHRGNQYHHADGRSRPEHSRARTADRRSAAASRRCRTGRALAGRSDSLSAGRATLPPARCGSYRPSSSAGACCRPPASMTITSPPRPPKSRRRPR